MRLVPLLALATLSPLAAPQTTSAQTAPRTAPPKAKAANVVVLQTPSSAACPVGLQARRTPAGDLVNVSPGARHREQGYQITFLPGNDHATLHAILQARLTLHGLAGARVIPAGDSAAGDATESFSVSPSRSGARAQWQSTVYTERLTGVQWIELNELTYADGATWHGTPGNPCRIAPDGFTLVGVGK